MGHHEVDAPDATAVHFSVILTGSFTLYVYYHREKLWVAVKRASGVLAIWGAASGAMSTYFWEVVGVRI